MNLEHLRRESLVGKYNSLLVINTYHIHLIKLQKAYSLLNLSISMKYYSLLVINTSHIHLIKLQKAYSLLNLSISMKYYSLLVINTSRIHLIKLQKAYSLLNLSISTKWKNINKNKNIKIINLVQIVCRNIQEKFSKENHKITFFNSLRNYWSKIFPCLQNFVAILDCYVNLWHQKLTESEKISSHLLWVCYLHIPVDNLLLENNFAKGNI